MIGYKWIGSFLIIGSCTGFGISLAVHQKHEERLLSQLTRMIEEMLWELPFQLTPLPDLLRHCARHKPNMLSELFIGVANQLDRQVLPDPISCIEAEMSRDFLSFPRLHRILLLLGASLGRFDLSGQIKGLASVKTQCTQELAELHAGRDTRLRSYRVLGLCAGIALAILLM